MPPPARITGNFAFASSAAACVEALLAAGAALDRERPRNLALDVAVEEVARNVELRRPHLEHRAIECAARQFRHARPVVHVRLVLGDLREDRQLLGLLEAAEAERHRAGFRRDDDDRRMRPVRGRGRRHEIGDAGAVLRDADAVPAGHARIAVGHVAAALLVRDRDEADAGERKQIERIHVRRADDAEDVVDALRDQRFDERLGRRHLLAALTARFLDSVIVFMRVASWE